MEWKIGLRLMQAFSAHRFVRFCIVGSLAYFIDAGSAWVLLKFLPKVAALALSYLFSCLFHYSCTKRWTFRDPSKVSVQQVWDYTWVNLATLVINTTLSAWLLQIFENNVFLAKAVALPPTSLVGFFLLRWFVFRTGELHAHDESNIP